MGVSRPRSGEISAEQARLVDQLTAVTSANASLSDVRHIVILTQENRSFDHYFGTLSGTRGFSDPDAPRNANGTPIFDQYGFQPGTGPDAAGYLQPFRLRNEPRRPARPARPCRGPRRARPAAPRSVPRRSPMPG